MKPFNLKEYIKNPSHKVVTRDGKPVRIICTDANQVYSDKPGTFPVVALIMGDNNREFTFTYREDGLYEEGQRYSCDLFFATVKNEGWVNLYMVSDVRNFPTETCYIYTTKEEALEHALGNNYIETVHIEWEEFIYETV